MCALSIPWLLDPPPGVMLGLATRFLSNINQTTCDYVGENANRVYQELSGCSASTLLPLENPIEVPSVIEINATGGSTVLEYTFLCGAQLNGTCFRRELFSDAALQDVNTTVPPISVVSLAMLDDLGYTVDYSQADPVDLNASCVCSDDSETEDPVTRKLQREENADVALADLPGTPPEVVAYAKEELAKMNEKILSYMINSEDHDGNFVGVGIPSMIVMYRDGDATRTYTVTSNEGEDNNDEGEDADMLEEEIDVEGEGDIEGTGENE